MLKNFYLPHAGKLSLVRVWRGAVKDGTTLGDMRVGGVYRLFGGQQQNVGSAEAGEIVALGPPRRRAHRRRPVQRRRRPSRCRSRRRLEPMYAFAVTAANRNDEVKLSGAFAKLTDEDPALQVETDRETHQTLLWGQGEIHLRVALDRLKNKYNVEVAAAPAAHALPRDHPQGHPGARPAQEAVRRPWPVRRREDRDPARSAAARASSSRTRSWAAPCRASSSRRSRLARASICSGDRWAFPWSMSPSPCTTASSTASTATSCRSSSPPAQALKEGLPQCDPVLLEPILSVTISVPSDYTAKALQLVSGKRGQILGYEAKRDWNGWDEISAQIPQGEMHDLIVTLRSLSQGTGFFEWALRPPPGGAGPAGAGDRRQAPRSGGIGCGCGRRDLRAAAQVEATPLPAAARLGAPAHARLRGFGGKRLLRVLVALALLPTVADPDLPRSCRRR